MKPWEEFAETATVEAGPWDDFKESTVPVAATGPWDDFKEAAPEPDRSFSGALKQGLDAPLEAIGTTAEVLGLPRIGKAIKGLTEAPVNYESAGQRVAQPQPGDFTVGGFGVGSIPRAITEQLGQVAGSIVSRAVGALAGRAIGSAIGGSGGAPSGPGALLTAATGGAVGSKVGSFLGPFAFGAMQIAGPTALERARNNGRTEPNKEDLAVALTTAASSGALDAIGAKFLPGGEKAVGSWVGKIGKAILGEGATETGQSVIEQAGGTAATEVGLKVSARQAIAEGLVGAGAGGASTAILSPLSVEKTQEEAKVATEQVDATIDEVAAAEPPPVVPEEGDPFVYQDPFESEYTPDGGADYEGAIRSIQKQFGMTKGEAAFVLQGGPEETSQAVEAVLSNRRGGQRPAESPEHVEAYNQGLREAEEFVNQFKQPAGTIQLEPASVDDQFRQGSGTADTTSTEQISPTGQQPTTPETETEVSPEAAPQGVSTGNLSAAQLEERIVTVLGKRSSAKTEAEKKQYLEEARVLTDRLKTIEGQSMGPGAASSAETLADYAERKFGVRFGEDPRMAPELKEAAGNRFYEVLPNKVTAREATDLIDRVGDDQAERLIRDDKGDASFAVRSTVGQILIQRLNRQYQSLKETNPEQAEAVLNRAADLAEWQMEFGTRLGQGVQAFSMWMKLTPEGKLLGIKKAVRKARERHRQQHEKEVSEVLDVLGTDRTQEEKTTDMQRLGKKNRVARRVRKKIRQLTENPQDVKSFYDIASKELGLPELTPEQELELRDLAGKVDAAKEGLPKWEASRKFWDKAKKVKGFTAQDLLLGYYYGNILSGAGTQIVNAVDTLFNVIHEANTLAISNPQAAATIYAGLGRGLVNSKADAFLAISKGRRISSGLLADTMGIMEESNFGQKGGVDIIGKDAFSRMAKSVAESKVAAPLNAWKYIGRLMSASDAVMFRGAQEMRAGLLAYRIATEEGLTNSQRTKRVNEILGWDRVDEFMAQAKEEGYSGNEQAARAAELMIMQRPEGLQQDSSAFAAESTYNHKPEGLLGLGSELAGRFSDKYPAFRLIVPFTNIVANVFNRRLDNLPLVALYRSKKGYYGSEEAGKNAITRMLLSSAMLTTLISMSATGLFEITGQGPEDPEKKRQLKETGWRPYSLKIGDKYYSYASTPISLGLGIIGNMQDWSRYRKPSKRADKAFTEALVYSVFGLGSYLFSQSFISGMANFFDTMSGNTGQREFAIRNFTSQTASSVVPLTGLLKDIDTVFDDARKETKTMGAAVLASIPFARYAGKPALNAFGEPIKTGRIRPLSRFVSEEKKDNAWQVVNDKQLRVPVPDPFFMTDEQNYEFQKESGKQTKQWVLDNAEKLKDMSTEKAQKLMSNETEKIRDGIKASLMMKFLKEEEEANAQGKN